MHNFELMGLGLGLSYIAIVVVISLRVIMKRRAPGVSLAWLILVIVLPYAGALLYILVGERTLGRRRAKRPTGGRRTSGPKPGPTSIVPAIS